MDRWKIFFSELGHTISDSYIYSDRFSIGTLLDYKTIKIYDHCPWKDSIKDIKPLNTVDYYLCDFINLYPKDSEYGSIHDKGYNYPVQYGILMGIVYVNTLCPLVLRECAIHNKLCIDKCTCNKGFCINLSVSSYNRLVDICYKSGIKIHNKDLLDQIYGEIDIKDVLSTVHPDLYDLDTGKGDYLYIISIKRDNDQYLVGIGTSPSVHIFSWNTEIFKCITIHSIIGYKSASTIFNSIKCLYHPSITDNGILWIRGHSPQSIHNYIKDCKLTII